MAIYSVDPVELDHLATTLTNSVEDMAAYASQSAATLSQHGYVNESWLVGLRLAQAQDWATGWAGSLRTRIALLDGGRALPSTTVRHVVTSATSLAHARTTEPIWQLFSGTPARPTRVGAEPSWGPSMTPSAGETIGRALLDALSDGDLDRILQLLDEVATHLTDLPFLGALFTTLDADITGLFPTLLLDLGVNPSELARYTQTLGAALAVLESEASLPFTAADLMAGHEGFGVTPLIYLDFGRFSVEFLVEIAGPALTAYTHDPLPLRGPEYQLPDGTIASPDPRLALVRSLLDHNTAEQRSALGAIGRSGLMRDLLSPATPWADNGEAVAELLEALWGTTAEHAAMTMALAMDGVSRLTPAPVLLGIMTAVAPHLPSLVHETVFGETQIEFEQTELRAALDTWSDRGAGTASSFLFNVSRHDEARTLLQQALAALIVATLSEAFDPQQAEAMAPYADDLGAVVQLVVDAQLLADLEAGERADLATDVVMEVLGMAFGLVGSTVAVTMKASGFIAWAMEEMAGGGNAAFLAASAAGHSTDNTENALRDGFTSMRGIRDFAIFTLAAELHAAGLLQLPEALLEEGELVVPRKDEDWDALVAAVAEADFDPEPWFNHVAAIAGYGLPTMP